MTCPDCDEPMDREDRTAEEQHTDITFRPGEPLRITYSVRSVFYGAEYFCPKCHSSWFWSKREGLQPIGNGTPGWTSDTIGAYAAGAYDENGQVWD